MLDKGGRGERMRRETQGAISCGVVVLGGAPRCKESRGGSSVTQPPYISTVVS